MHCQLVCGFELLALSCSESASSSKFADGEPPLAASHWEVAWGGLGASGEVHSSSRGSNSRPTSLNPALSRELLTRVVAHSVTTGTSMRVAERAGGRGSTARVARVAAAAVAAVCAVSDARACAARAF